MNLTHGTLIPQETSLLNASGVVVGPGATTDIAILSNLPNGLYLVDVYFGFDRGAPVTGTDARNMRLFVTGIGTHAVLPIQAVLNRLDYLQFVVNLFNAAVNQQMSVGSIAAGTAGVGYFCALIAKRVIRVP